MTGLAAQRGFADPARESQQIFRAAMDAMARPGTIKTITTGLAPPPPLSPAAAALALTLADYETPVWLDASLAASMEVASFLRFHAGASIVSSPEEAAFALAASPEVLPALDSFALGTIDYPDRSTTLILQVETLRAGDGWRLSGPGVPGGVRFHAAPTPAGFVPQREALRSLFPRGIDCFFVAGAALAALPRTAKLEG
ncbi:MAG TPA: phosphonate C-P lyase system protein PhnH [Roseiarcus sp.]|nr:phosphonate C-P lyase system protein PhnH [Roseiarcus sp.]